MTRRQTEPYQYQRQPHIDSDFILIVYRNYGLLPEDKVFDQEVSIDSEHSEYTVYFDSDVNGKAFALEIRWSPSLEAGDTALLEPPVEIDFNYQIEEVDEPLDYRFDLPQKSELSIQRPKRPALPDQDVEYNFDLPRGGDSLQVPKRKLIPPGEDVEYNFDLPFLRK